MDTLIKCIHFDIYQILDIDLVLVVSVFFATAMVCCYLFVLFLVLLVCTLKRGIYGMYIAPKCFKGILTTFVCKYEYTFIYTPSRELTYPTFAKRKSSSKVRWKGIC